MLHMTGVLQMADNDEFGYGKVAKNVKKSIKDINIESDIEICLDIPPYKFSLENSYKIGFTTWESTEIPSTWIYSLNNVNEIWTASKFISDVYSKYTNNPIYVFNHGLDAEYLPKKRSLKNTKTILFIGDELRSNEELVVEAYKQLNINKNYKLIIKRKRPGKNIGYPGITIIECLYNKDQMIDLLYSADVLVYPTSGEGFGLIGLEAIGTGLPTISTTGWSEYKDLITVSIDSKLSNSKWKDVHNGKMFDPSIESIKNSILFWIENYENLIEIAYENAQIAHEKFNWETVNNKIIERILKINSDQLYMSSQNNMQHIQQ